MPPTACGVEERVSAKVTAAAVLGRGGAGGAAGALLYDGVGAVGGRTDYRVALHCALLTAGKQERSLLTFGREIKQRGAFLSSLLSYLHT